jgi:hypothetical protein
MKALGFFTFEVQNSFDDLRNKKVFLASMSGSLYPLLSHIKSAKKAKSGPFLPGANCLS